jgi:hypothetical protein
MKYPDYTGIVPAHYTGKEIDAHASAELPDDAAAKTFYETVKERLLEVNNWHHLAGIISARFQVTDPSGNEVDRKVQKGDFLKVDIPGPGSKEGHGFDWVKVEELTEVSQDNIQSVGFRVRPSENPRGDKENIAHFYDSSATSNFLVTREGKKVTATVIDRNVKPNDDTESLTDKLRHTAIAMSAIASFSNIQWKKLAEGLVDRET